MSSQTLSLPPRRPKLQTDLDFNFGLRFSLLAHAVLIGGVLLKSLVFPGKPIMYIPSLRVDVVGLPDILKKDLKKSDISEILKKAEREAPKPAPKAARKERESPKEIAKPDEMVLKPKVAAETPAERKRRMRGALDRLKALQKIQSETQSAAVAPIQGNRISKGTSLSGDARESDQPTYLDQVRDRLQENWSLPVWLARQKLSATVQIWIDARGRLTNVRFIKPSGNTQFDEAVRRTLLQSEPFPPPTAAFTQLARVDGILVGFPL